MAPPRAKKATQKMTDLTPPDSTVENPPTDDGLFPQDTSDTTTADNVADPHEVDENPELHIGEELLDPWQDATALDWPNDDDDEDEN